MSENTNLWEYMGLKISRLLSQGHKLTAGNYQKAQRRLRGFADSADLRIENITKEFVGDFNKYIEDEKGGNVNLNEKSKEELMFKCKYLQRKYDTPVGKLSELVRA